MHMKKIFLSVCISLFSFMAFAQDCDLPIGIAFYTNSPQTIPSSSQRIVANKLRQILTANGVSANFGIHTFALVPEYEVIGKSVTPGPPKQIVYQLQVSLKVLNAADELVFSAFTKEVNGVGNTEAAAVNDAIKRIGNKDKGVEVFMGQVRQKIIKYYDNNFEKILAKAQMLAKTRKYEESLNLLLTVPECCKGYERALIEVMQVWQSHINLEGQKLLMKAKAVWASGQNAETAIEAAEILAQIDPESFSYSDAEQMLAEIKAKAGEGNVWDVNMKKYDDSISIEQQRIAAAKEVALAYAQNQQPTQNLIFADGKQVPLQ